MRVPPLLIGISSIEDYLDLLDSDTRRQHEEEIVQLYNRHLPPVVSLKALSALFGYSPKFLTSMVIKTEKYYRSFQINKGKKKRIINAPKVSLKIIQKWFGHHLSEQLTFHESVHGFIKGKSSLTAAQQHINAQWVYSLDLENFFPTIPIAKIIQALQQIGYSLHAAELMAKLCCYYGFLAQGSPASPVLSNLIFQIEDETLSALAHSHNCTYTRYADDLVFSGRGDCPEQLIAAIKEIVATHGWRIAANKEFCATLPQRLKVHGLLVHGNKLRLTKGYRKRIRTFKYLLANERVKPEDVSKIKGHLSYAQSVDDFIANN